MYRISSFATQLRTLAFAVLALTANYAFAHEEFRVIGTLASSTETQIQVRYRDGKTLSIAVNKQTVITKDKASVDASALTTGNSVVIDALGDSEADLVAIEIRIVPPIVSR
jgi:hypothetical protein